MPFIVDDRIKVTANNGFKDLHGTVLQVSGATHTKVRLDGGRTKGQSILTADMKVAAQVLAPYVYSDTEKHSNDPACGALIGDCGSKLELRMSFDDDTLALSALVFEFGVTANHQIEVTPDNSFADADEQAQLLEFLTLLFPKALQIEIDFVLPGGTANHVMISIHGDYDTVSLVDAAAGTYDSLALVTTGDITSNVFGYFAETGGSSNAAFAAARDGR